MPTAKKQKVPQLPKFSSKFYKKELSVKQVAQKYLKDEKKPLNILETLRNRPFKSGDTKSVVHLFTKDLRITDNTALFKAKQLSEKLDVPLICLFVYCKEDLYRHYVGGFQLQFINETIESLQDDLKDLNIPLTILDVSEKKDYVSKISTFLKDNQSYYLFGNISYEVDEIRDFIKLHRNDDFFFQSFHDTCVVEPGVLKSGKGTTYSIFTPWYRTWSKHVNSNHPKPYPKLSSQDYKISSSLFDFKIPDIPPDKKLNNDQLTNFKKLYMAGESNALSRLDEYITPSSIKEYDENRDQLSVDVSSHLSHYLAIGTLSARTILSMILDRKILKSVDSGNTSIVQWVRQVAWRDFYKEVISYWPHVCMFLPYQLDYVELEWEYNEDHFKAWCEGNTGFPVVDACMRQLKQTGFMSNRGRMIVASFLSKHLLIDWRYGERFFMESLIDGDFASNNGGWGFSSSTGVDPQPYFRIFNPYLQSERFDKDGNYIKKWVPELKDIEGKNIHNPYSKTSETINDYPFPIVDHKTARERALNRYKDAKY